MNRETISAIFVIVLVSLFIFANFFVGFVLSLYLIAMTVSFGIIFFHPRSGLYAIVFLTFIFERFFTLSPIILGRSEIKFYPIDALFIAIIFGIFFQFLQKRIKISLKKVDFYLIWFIVLVFFQFLLSIFVSQSDNTLAFSGFKNYALYALFYFAVVILIDNKKYLLRFLKFFLAGAIGILFFIFYGILAGRGLWSKYTPLSTEGVRLLAFTHGFYLSMTLIVLIAYFVFNRKKINVSQYVLSGIWIVGVLGSMMRHLWAGLGVAMLFLFLFSDLRQKKYFKKIVLRYITMSFIALILITYLALILPHSKLNSVTTNASEEIFSRVESIFNFSQDKSFSWRDLVWNEALSSYTQYPILGVGLGKSIPVENSSYHDFVELRDIHNSPLAIFVQMGPIVFLFLLVFVGKIMRELYIRKKNWIGVAFFSLGSAYLVFFLFQPYLETNLLGIFFWIILAFQRNLIFQKYENIRNQ